MITRYKLLNFICLVPFCFGSESPLNATLINATLAPPSVSVPQVATTQVTTEGLTILTNSSSDESSVPLPPQKPPPAPEANSTISDSLGLSCSNSSECKADNSDCLGNVCSCMKGYISSAEHLRCLKVALKLEDECSEDIQCSTGLSSELGPTTCLNFKCSCSIGMTLSDGKCQGPKFLNSNCSSDDDCSIRKSQCVDGLCLCHAGFVPNSDDNECLPITLQLQKFSSPSTNCEEDIQCQTGLGDDAICVVEQNGGVCKCKPGTHMVTNNCIPYKDLGAQCSRDEECVSKDTNTESENSRICNGGMCKCSPGWHQIDNICTGGASQNTLAGSIIALLVFIWITQKQ